MAVEAIGVFLVIRDGQTGDVEYRFHNAPQKGSNGLPVYSYRTDVVEGTSRTYNYIPFIYQGGTRNRSGDNITAGIGLAPNEISMAFAADITETVDANNAERLPMIVRAVTVAMDPQTYTTTDKIITDETWVAAGMTYNADLLEIVLSSAIDAVNALAPSYCLSRYNVGRLPVSTSVQI